MDACVFERMCCHETEHWWFVVRRQILRDHIASLGLPRDARILEAGCGSGGNLDMLAEFGAVSAFEPDDYARASAAKRSARPVESGHLPDDLPYRPGSFDLIATLDVLEHVREDRDSVRALRSLLRPGGHLVMTVPAYAWLWSEHDERHHHQRRYTRTGVRRLVEGAGLSVRKCTYFNTLLAPAVMLRRGLARLAGLEFGPDDEMPGPSVNALLMNVFGAERQILRLSTLPFGISVLCIAERA